MSGLHQRALAVRLAAAHVSGLGLDLRRPPAGALQRVAATSGLVLELAEQQGQLALPALLGGDLGTQALLFAYPMTARPSSNCRVS